MSEKKDSLDISNKEYYDILSRGMKVTRSLSKKPQEATIEPFSKDDNSDSQKKSKSKNIRGRPSRKHKEDSSSSDENQSNASSPEQASSSDRKRNKKEKDKISSKSSEKETKKEKLNASKKQITSKQITQKNKSKEDPADDKKNIDKISESSKEKKKFKPKEKKMEDDMEVDSNKERSKQKEDSAKLKDKAKKDKKSIDEKQKLEEVKMEVDKEEDKTDTKEDKSKLGKRLARPPPSKQPEVKRKKTEKGEKLVGGDKRKFKHIEWQYGKHCSKDLWIGKKVKVKIPAKKKDEESEYRFGRIVNIKENEFKEKNSQTTESKILIYVEWANDKKKSKEWININETRVYIFGQILFMKHNHDEDQIEFINKTYGWKGKERKAIPIPVIELIDTSDKNKSITPHQDLNEKIPLQYFMIEKAKKIKQDVLYDYREFKDEYFDYLKENIKNGEKLLSKILKYKKHYSQWIDEYSKIEIDIEESFKKYCSKIVRVYKGDRN